MRFLLLTEADVQSVLTMDDLIDAMASALSQFSRRAVEQPVRTVIPIAPDAFFGTMPAFARASAATARFGAASPPHATPGATARFGAASPPHATPGATARFGAASPPHPTPGATARFGGAGSPEPGAALGAKLVTVFGGNAARGLPSHLASIVLLDPETGALRALLDGRYITEARTAAVSAVSSRLLARRTAKSLAIVGSGVQAHSHLEALRRVHDLRQVSVWSPNRTHRERFVDSARAALQGRVPDSGAQTASPPTIAAVDHPGEAVVGADIVVLVTAATAPVIESGWVKPGAHVIGVGACRPTQREIDPALTARARLFVDSREAALVEAGDVVMAIEEGRFGPDHIVAELGEVVDGAPGRRDDGEITIFKSLGMAIEDVVAANLAYRKAVEKRIGRELDI
jgi:ornithine cyclodeaminase